MSRLARTKLFLAIAIAPFVSQTKYTSVPVPGGRAFIGRHSTLIDIRTFLYIWDDEAFPADCAGRVVLDIGAHKGYFGAWALSQGAVAVISCEPGPENFEALRRSRSTNVRRGAWDIERLAVGATSGRATLFLSNESWGHSLYEHMVEAAGSEEIEVIDLRPLLVRARARRPNSSIILKLNIEGAAGDVLFATPPKELASVVEVYLDHEPGSPHSINDILKHLQLAGLTEVEEYPDQLFRITRPAQGPN